MKIVFNLIPISPLLVAYLLRPTYLYANTAPQCMTGSSKNLHLAGQFNDAKKNKIVSQLLQKYKIQTLKKEEAATLADCPSCNQQTQSTKNLNDLASAMLQSSPLQIKPECMSTANKIKTSTTYLNCPSETRQKPPQNECMTDEMIKYQSATITEALKCIKSESQFPLSIKSLFDMYTNETGFKPNYSSGAGTGLGQLTSIFIKDVHQKGRGLETLKKVATSSSPNCEIIKSIAEKDISQKPQIEKKCNFISYGEGFERNILYTLIGLNTLWSKNIEPALKDYTSKHRDDQNLTKIKELLILNAYGAGGPRNTYAVVRALRTFKPDQFLKHLKTPLITTEEQNLTKYLVNINNKQKQLVNLFSSNSTLNFKKNGSSVCVEN